MNGEGEERRRGTVVVVVAETSVGKAVSALGNPLEEMRGRREGEGEEKRGWALREEKEKEEKEEEVPEGQHRQQPWCEGSTHHTGRT